MRVRRTFKHSRSSSIGFLNQDLEKLLVSGSVVPYDEEKVQCFV